MRQIVYKIATVLDWRQAETSGHYNGSADDVRDGFIHLSSQSQLAGTLEKHFKGKTDLVLVAFEEDKLAPHLKREPSRGGELSTLLRASGRLGRAMDAAARHRPGRLPDYSE